ncbi:hypothetical protein [Variovorax rhizosphaerae]|uniref:Uncharacterized protein n=1 Tax=Variovorax rhizosphaerae TaxID=1836200 RepID=A0ABU8WSE7_9BURK
MLPPHLVKRLSRPALADSIAMRSSSAFVAIHVRLADAFAEAGVDPGEAEALAHGVVDGIITAVAGASDKMVKAVVATSETAKSAPRH